MKSKIWRTHRKCLNTKPVLNCFLNKQRHRGLNEVWLSYKITFPGKINE